MYPVEGQCNWFWKVLPISLLGYNFSFDTLKQQYATAHYWTSEGQIQPTS